MRLIDAEAFIENLKKFLPGIHQTYLAAAVMRIVKEVIDKQPTIEVVPKELYEQILWKRNIAMEQLEEHGIGFASKKKNEVEAKPVVHAHWENREFVNNSWIGIVCSNCEKHPLCDGFGKKVFSDHCPHCGARMTNFAGDINGGSVERRMPGNEREAWHHAEVFERMAFKLQEERELLIWFLRKVCNGTWFCDCDGCANAEQFGACGDIDKSCRGCEREGTCPCGTCERGSNLVFDPERAKKIREEEERRKENAGEEL